MSQQETVEVEINEQGIPTITVKGVKGKGCKALTEGLEKALGTVVSREETREMHQEAAHQQGLKQR